MFLRAQEHFNAVAVIVVPLHTLLACRNSSTRTKSPFYSLTPREVDYGSKILNSQSGRVLDRDTWRDDIDTSLQYEAKKGGFEIKLANIIGPDHIIISEIPKQYWAKTITSGVSRPVDFVAGNRLLRVKKWQTWLFGAINGTSKEYLQGYVNDIHGRKKIKNTPRHTQGYRDGFTRNGKGLSLTPSPKTASSVRAESSEDFPLIYCFRRDDYLFFFPTNENSEYRKYISPTQICQSMKKNVDNPEDIKGWL